MSRLLRGRKDFAHECREARLSLIGNMLAIDPGSRVMGWAIYVGGMLRLSGTVDMPQGSSISARLCSLREQLNKYFGGYKFDVLVMELIPRGTSHIYLHWACGVIVSAVDTRVILQCPISSWKAVTSESYHKTDENDAIMLGATAVILGVGGGRDGHSTILSGDAEAVPKKRPRRPPI